MITRRQLTAFRRNLRLSDEPRHVLYYKRGTDEKNCSSTPVGNGTSGNHTGTACTTTPTFSPVRRVRLECDGNNRPVQPTTAEHRLRFYVEPLTGPRLKPIQAVAERQAGAAVVWTENFFMRNKVLLEWTGGPLVAAVVVLVAFVFQLGHRGLLWRYGVERVIRRREARKHELAHGTDG
jgi:hypothetical protein